MRAVARRGTSVTVRPAERLELGAVEVPGDFSSAAPFIVAATLVPGSELHIHGVNLNPRRTGLLDILERMGARITVYNRRRIARRAGRRPRGALRGARRDDGRPRRRCRWLIDELPLFALAASCARGDSVLRGAEELRAKETDRIEATVDGAARARRQHVQATTATGSGSGACRRGCAAALSTPRRPPDRDARRGRRARLAARACEIEDAESVAVSFPGFFELLDRLRGLGRSRRAVTPLHSPRSDRRHRRPCRGRQELGRPRARASARLSLPRHRRDVPRAHLARARAWHCRSTTGRRWQLLARANPVEFGDDGRVSIAGTTSRRGSASPDRRVRAGRRASPEVRR